LFAPSFSNQNGVIYHGILSAKVWFHTQYLIIIPILLIILWGFDFLQSYFDPIVELAKRPLWQRWAVYYFFLFAIILLGNTGHTQFIYFQF